MLPKSDRIRRALFRGGTIFSSLCWLLPTLPHFPFSFPLSCTQERRAYRPDEEMAMKTVSGRRELDFSIQKETISRHPRLLNSLLWLKQQADLKSSLETRIYLEKQEEIARLGWKLNFLLFDNFRFLLS